MNKIAQLEKITEEALNCGDSEKCKTQLAALAVLQDTAPKMIDFKNAKYRKDGIIELPEEAFNSIVYNALLNCYMIATSETYRNSCFAKEAINAGKKIAKAEIPCIMERFLKERNKKK